MTHPDRKPDQHFAQGCVRTPEPAPGRLSPGVVPLPHLDYDLRALTVQGLDHYVASADIDRRFHVRG